MAEHRRADEVAARRRASRCATRRSAEMDQFRADFKLVWQWRLRSGWFSQEEFGPIYDHAGRAVRDNSGDPGGWRAPSETSRSRPPTSGPALRGRKNREEVRRESAT